MAHGVEEAGQVVEKTSHAVEQVSHTALGTFTEIDLMSLTQYVSIWLIFFGVLSFIYGIYAIKKMKREPRETDMAIAGLGWGLIMIAFGWYYLP